MNRPVDIELAGVRKVFGQVAALDGADLRIGPRTAAPRPELDASGDDARPGRRSARPTAEPRC